MSTFTFFPSVVVDVRCYSSIVAAGGSSPIHDDELDQGCSTYGEEPAMLSRLLEALTRNRSSCGAASATTAFTGIRDCRTGVRRDGASTSLHY